MAKSVSQKADQKQAGIYVVGTISLRSKRSVPKDKPTHEVVTYLIKGDSGHSYYIDDFDPDSYYEIDEYVELPVYIKPYVNKKTGQLSYSMSVQKEKGSVNRIQGEVF